MELLLANMKMVKMSHIFTLDFLKPTSFIILTVLSGLLCFISPGSLASSIFDPLKSLVGASGGVYALMGGYFMNVIVVRILGVEVSKTGCHVAQASLVPDMWAEDGLYFAPRLSSGALPFYVQR